jgi:hypothetical protein
MKIAVLPTLALLVSPVAIAQTASPAPPDTNKDIQLNTQNPIKPEGAVPVKAEPHHVLVFQNDYLHVFNVTVPPMDATLLHQHDLPYIYLMLGTADVINAVAGKPEVHLTFEDGATRYSLGGFAHIARTDAGVPFHNITVELAHPQASPHNLPEKGKDRPLGSCPQSDADARRNEQVPFAQTLLCFESSEVSMELVTIEGGKDYSQLSSETAALLVAMSNANLDVSLGGEHAAFLHTGDVLWLPVGKARKVVDFLGTRSRFLLITLKDSGESVAK